MLPGATRSTGISPGALFGLVDIGHLPFIVSNMGKADATRLAEQAGSIPYDVTACPECGGRLARSRWASPRMVCTNVTAVRTLIDIIHLP